MTRLKVASGPFCYVAGVVAVAVSLSGAMTAQPAAQAKKKVRLNKIIEQLEQGKPAIRGKDHILMDLEHADIQRTPPKVFKTSINMTEIDAGLAAYAEHRDSMGRMELTPVIRVGEREDASYGWMVSRILDQGALGVQFPEINNGAQALRAIKAMRYPPQQGATNEKYPEPRGERGAGFGMVLELWGLSPSEYLDVADVWPLNPDGELFAVLQIETLEGVKNVREILNTPGVGAIDVSPNDLHLKMGYAKYRADHDMRGNHPEVEKTYQMVLRECLAYNKTAAPNRKVACGGAFAASEIPRRIKEGWTYFVPLGG